MKDLLQILLICVLAAYITLLITPAQADGNNEPLKECLAKYDYSPEKFETFNWQKASACFHAKSIKQSEETYAKLRAFLKENPWYKGKNWKWEDTAEYTCIKRYDLNGIELCTKPIYLN